MAELPNDSYCSLDELLIGRKPPTRIIEIVLEAHAHVAAEQDYLRGRWELSGSDGRNEKHCLWWQEINHGLEDFGGIRECVLDRELSSHI
jgi:hypothetical protein